MSRWICVKFSCGEHPVRRRSESDNILQDLGLVLAVEIDARDALVDAAHQLIRDGPKAVGKARQLDAVAAILAEDRDDVSGTRVISTMHMSMQMRPTCGTRLPCSRNDTLLDRLRGKPSA